MVPLKVYIMVSELCFDERDQGTCDLTNLLFYFKTLQKETTILF